MPPPPNCLHPTYRVVIIDILLSTLLLQQQLSGSLRPAFLKQTAFVGAPVRPNMLNMPKSVSVRVEWTIFADGNATTPETGEPLFVLRPEDGGQGASLFTASTLDVNDGLYYRLVVIASNKPLNDSQITNWNGTRLDLDVRIVDIDNNGPTFDSELPGRCSGIGKLVERGL